MRLHHWSLFLLLALAPVYTAAAQDDATIIYLLRHAEKASDGTQDPSLTEQGQTRATHLAHLLQSAGITHIHSTDFKRTHQTVAPLTAKLGLTVKSYNPRDLEGFASSLKSMTGIHLVSGHSNTTPALVELLGGDPGSPIHEDEYGRLYIVTLAPGQAVRTIVLHTSPYQ